MASDAPLIEQGVKRVETRPPPLINLMRIICLYIPLHRFQPKQRVRRGQQKHLRPGTTFPTRSRERLRVSAPLQAPSITQAAPQTLGEGEEEEEKGWGTTLGVPCWRKLATVQTTGTCSMDCQSKNSHYHKYGVPL